jgi:saccharopine dehydrogenase (NAD+, L-lysine-forming)
MLIYLRAETYPNEFRSPLVPEDIRTLKMYSNKIYVERSDTRCIPNDLWTKAGAELTDKKWYEQPPGTIIVGLKELDHIDKLNRHIHVYFSHSFKGQCHANEILRAFKISHSLIYDLEYFKTKDNKRTLAFGFYAGLAAATLGLTQNYNRLNGRDDIHNLTYWKSKTQMIDFCRFNKSSKIAIIGNGRCSKGVQFLLDLLNIKYTIIDKGKALVPQNYDIIFNCILLNSDFNKVWVSESTILEKQLLIVDISCDYMKKNNPFPIYSKGTTWDNPVLNINKVSIIAIDNLPSLLPKESSTEFSIKLTNLLTRYGDEEWLRNFNIYNDIIKSMDQ